jgi:type I restriction enzyme M protein
MNTHRELAGFIWSLADLLRGDYKKSEYGKVILPLTVLRRLDCVLESSGDQPFHNTSGQTFATISADPAGVEGNLRAFLRGFSANAAEIVDKYGFDAQIGRLDAAKRLYPVVRKFAGIDLRPDRVDNHQMGYVFEELIRRFSEISNETAGEHFTPREVVKLMVNLLIGPDTIGPDTVAGSGATIDILDPACGTGGMLSAAEDHLRSLHPDATVRLYGQEVNAESAAICRSDMMLRGRDPAYIAVGNSVSDDGHRGRTFDYLLANPPFGVEWTKVRDAVVAEAKLGHDGRFGAGLPRVSDGSLLFLQHMLAKMRPVDAGGSRVAIVFNAAPLCAGAAGSGESNIRRWILENDLLEGIVGLPDQLFYNTGIATYFWILSNRKAESLAHRVVLLDARDRWTKMRKSLGDKRKLITDAQIAEITRSYVDAVTDPRPAADASVRVCATSGFGYRRVPVRTTVVDAAGERRIARDYENVPLDARIEDYMAREVLPYAPGARAEETNAKVGYEIPFSRHFSVSTPPRSLDAIDADLRDTEQRIHELLAEVGR